MLALRYYQYGNIDQLVLEQCPKLVPKTGETLVRVVCAALNPKDALFRKGRFRIISGTRFPKTPGVDFSGIVLRDDSSTHPIGTRVFGALNEWTFARGTLAEEVVVKHSELAKLPAEVSFEQGAATALAGLTSLQALRDIAHLQPGQKVLINGASGGVGTFAIQIARKLGAQVTTISSSQNRKFCADLGAHHTEGYDSPTKQTDRFDVIFDVYGNLPLAKARRRLTRAGVWVGTVPTPFGLVKDIVSRLLPLRERLVVVKPRPRDLDLLATWLSEDSLQAVVDKQVSLANYQEGFRLLESRRAKGKILVRVSDEG